MCPRVSDMQCCCGEAVGQRQRTDDSGDDRARKEPQASIMVDAGILPLHFAGSATVLYFSYSYQLGTIYHGAPQVHRD